MSLISYENGKFHELQVKDYLYEIGCIIDNRAFWHDIDRKYLVQSEIDSIPKRLDIFPFNFKSQKVLKKDNSQQMIDKIADFASSSYIIEVKSISRKTKNFRQATDQLIGSILVEYKKYYHYLSYDNFKTNKEDIFYVINSPNDDKVISSIYEHLEDQKSWDVMKERFFVLNSCQIYDVFCDKAIEHFEKYEK